MLTRPQPELDLPTASSKSLLAALVLATGLHIILLLGIQFSAKKPPSSQNRSIEISLSYNILKQSPVQAKFLGAEHQEAVSAPQQPETSQPAPDPSPATTRPSLAAAPTPKASKPTQAAAPAIAPKSHTRQLLSQVEPQSKPISSVRPNPIATAPAQTSIPTSAPAPHPTLSAAILQQQISQLGEQIRNHQPSIQESKIKFANSVSTHKFLAAQYVKDWEDKVERTGNLNYPEAARKVGQAQMLTMDVGINHDGSIYSLRIVKSSGNPELDEAAKRIVRMSAPFAELPSELLQEVNVLVITRIWKFSDETGMTGK